MANRQLSQYNSDDRNINISSKEIFQEIFQYIIDKNITSINNQKISIKVRGATNRIDFLIKDLLLKKTFTAYLARSPRELRLQLLDYVEDRKIIPGDVITLFVEVIGSNCNIQIKSESLYLYVLERKSLSDRRYRVLIEHPDGIRNAQITTSDDTDSYLAFFNIIKSNEDINWGSTSFSAYIASSAKFKYIGVPYNKSLQLDYFDDIEDVL